MAFLQTALVMAVITLWLWRGEKLINRFLDSRHPKPLPLPESEPIPDDLLLYANGFQEDWAKQQTLDGLYEQRGKLGDWQKVRVALGISSGTI